VSVVKAGVFNVISSFTIETCIVCGCKFGLDVIYRGILRNGQGGVPASEGDESDGEDDGKNKAMFCCLNGHQQHFVERRDEVLAQAAVEAKRRAEFAEAKAERLETTVAKLKAESDRLKKKLKGMGGSTTHPEAAARATRLSTATRERAGRRRD